MARTGITEAQVTQAIEALLENNQPITVSSVRNQLGTGSYSTISTHLSHWRKAHESRKSTDHPDIPESVDKAFRNVWGMAWKMAQESLQTEWDALAASRKQMEQERHDMGTEISRLEGANAAAGEEVKKANALVDEKSNALHNMQNTMNDMRIENARLDEQAKAAELRAEELKEELNMLHARFQELAVNIKKDNPKSKE